MKTILTIANVVFWLGVALWLPVAVMLNFFWGFGGGARTTLGAHAFLATGTLFLPALGVVGYLSGSGVRRFSQLAVMLGLGGAALALAACLSIALYPKYPLRGPHELVAALMVLPGVGLPLTMAALWKRLRLFPKAWLYCSAWAVVLLAGTILVFQRKLDMALPLSASVSRWEHNDFQDYSNYYLRADHVDDAAAARYAAALGLSKRASLGSLECGPSHDPTWTPPVNRDIWELDARAPEPDRVQHPNGLSGCFTRVAWAGNSLYVCEVCDWGI